MSGAGLPRESLRDALKLGPGEDLVPLQLRVCATLLRWPAGSLVRLVAHDSYYAAPAWAVAVGRALHDLPVRPGDYERLVRLLVGRADLQAAVLAAWDLARSPEDPWAEVRAVLALLRSEVPGVVPLCDPLGCTCCPCAIPDRRSCKVHDDAEEMRWTDADEARVYPAGRAGPCGVHP